MLLFFFLHFATPLPFDRLREETVGGRTWIILLLLYENSLCFVIQTYTNNIAILIRATKKLLRIFTYVELHQNPQDVCSSNDS